MEVCDRGKQLPHRFVDFLKVLELAAQLVKIL